MKKITGKSIVLIACSLAIAPGAFADEFVWGNSASSGNVRLEEFDITPGGTVSLTQSFLVPNLTARNDNGRGVAVLGNTIYYTTANSGNIYITDATTHADLGILVNTGFPGIANVSTDGTFIYANSYQSSSGIINKYDTAGNLVGTVTVGAGFFGRDGFEEQNNPNILGGALTFISNRGDLTGPYDVYDANGNKIINDFIDPVAAGFSNDTTGIAYNGTNYFVSEVLNNELLEFSGTGAFMRRIDLSGIPSPFGPRLIEDLSALGNTVNNPPPNVPEPTSVLLLGSVVGLLAMRLRRNKVNVQ